MISPSGLGQKRLVSIDALRGFDMIMICGVDAFFHELEGKTGVGWIDALALQFEHPEWIGLTFYDFIFPLFLFIAGVTLPFSLNKSIEGGIEKKTIYRKAFFRMLILIGFGILYKNAPIPYWHWSQIRFVSVLGRIGFAGFITVILYLNFDIIKRLYIVIGILVMYYACVMWIPVPGYGAGDLSFEGNLIGWFDRHFLPGRLLQGTYDELGILTQFPAMCLTMLGAIAGDVLRNGSLTDSRKLSRLFLFGIVGIAIALIWSLHFPIAKRLWTSSYILLTAGTSFIMLGIFYWLIDVMDIQKWSFVFVVIGMNSLTVYLTYRLVNFRYTAQLLFSGFYDGLDEKWFSVLESLGALILVWVFLYFLYRRKIFFKI